jgi:hypothetical protein
MKTNRKSLAKWIIFKLIIILHPQSVLCAEVLTIEKAIETAAHNNPEISAASHKAG